MYNNKPIGVFDSGVGGITVLKELVNTLPNENYIYFGDTARVPYGEKTKEQLIGFSKEILDMFLAKDVKAVVMACNTSSALTLDIVKTQYDFPVFGLIEPVADYISTINAKNIGIMATKATVNSNAYKNAILTKSSQKNVFQVACPGLVEIVESGNTKTEEASQQVKLFLQQLLDNDVEQIVLGCTHYPYLSEVINAVSGNKVGLIDPAKQIVEQVKLHLEQNNTLNQNVAGKRQYLVSLNPESFVSSAQKLFSDCKKADLLKL